MIKLGKSSELQFVASVDTSKKGEDRIAGITLIDPSEEVRQDRTTFEGIAKVLAFRFVKTNEDGGLLVSSTSIQLEGGLIIDLERIEEAVPNKPVYNLTLRVTDESNNFYRKLKHTTRKLEQENVFLKREIKHLISMVEKMELIKESFRIPFDAIKDLVITFDCDGNVLVVNEASAEWFGMMPQEIVRRKYKSILKQNILEVIKQICVSKQPLTFEESVGKKVLQINYIPMTNKKSGAIEVVMLTQDITQRKQEEASKVEKGRNEGVAIMGGTIRHILNSSLHAILGFSQLALSSYDWPRETMIKYLKLIERTAQRMKKEINTIAEQKEYKPTVYMDVPGDEKCKQILAIERTPDATHEN